MHQYQMYERRKSVCTHMVLPVVRELNLPLTDLKKVNRQFKMEKKKQHIDMPFRNVKKYQQNNNKNSQKNQKHLTLKSELKGETQATVSMTSIHIYLLLKRHIHAQIYTCCGLLSASVSCVLTQEKSSSITILAQHLILW